MERVYSQEERYRKAEKQVKNILGFYTHLFVTLFIVPFIVILNYQMVPEEFHFYWIFIGAWCVGLLIHGINVFAISKLTAKKDWENQKIQELMGDEEVPTQQGREQEHSFMKAKKRVQEVKGFYAHLIVTVLTIPVIVWVNLKFVPGFHFFWFAAGGMTLAIFFHWLGVFGFSVMGFGKKWEQRKIKELLEREFN